MSPELLYNMVAISWTECERLKDGYKPVQTDYDLN